MEFPQEREARNIIREAREAANPLVAKVKRGERLSAEESRSLADANDKISAATLTIQECEEARRLSAEGAPGTPSGDGDNSPEDSAESRAWENYVRRGIVGPELRAAGEATGSAGGFLVPQGFWQNLQVAKKAYGGVVPYFRLHETDTGALTPWPTIDATTVVGSLIAENSQISDVDFVFGQGQMNAYLYSSGVHKISRQMAHDSAFDVQEFIQGRVAEALGRAEAAAAISGTGSSQPLGVITALNAATGMTSGGVYALGAGNKVTVIANGTSFTTPTTQATELVAGALNPTSVIGVIKSVDPAYRANARWFMSDAQFQAHKLVSDGFGRPYWPTLRDAEPTLEGYPVTVDPNIPNLAASTASGIIFGDLGTAMVVRRVRHGGLLRLEERYADFLQVGYIGFERFDFRANDLRAAVVVKPAAT